MVSDKMDRAQVALHRPTLDTQTFASWQAPATAPHYGLAPMGAPFMPSPCVCPLLSGEWMSQCGRNKVSAMPAEQRGLELPGLG